MDATSASLTALCGRRLWLKASGGWRAGYGRFLAPKSDRVFAGSSFETWIEVEIGAESSAICLDCVVPSSRRVDGTTQSKSDHVTLVQIAQPRRTQRRAEGDKDRSFSAILRRPLRLDV